MAGSTGSRTDCSATSDRPFPQRARSCPNTGRHSPGCRRLQRPREPTRPSAAMIAAPDTLALFGLASLVLALTPGPNWLYLLSRTLAQGRRAGIVSWAGTTCGLSFHMIAASLGLTALLLAVPYAYDAIR